jgi:hypothetical protein
MTDSPGRLEEILETFAPDGEGQAYFEASRAADRERTATAFLGAVAHVAAADNPADDPDPELA